MEWGIVVGLGYVKTVIRPDLVAYGNCRVQKKVINSPVGTKKT